MPSELELAVRSAAQGLPYQVESTANGFVVRPDLAEANRLGLLNQDHARTTFTHEVTQRGTTFVITDVVRSIAWEIDGPSLSLSIAGSVSRGRLIRTRRAWSWTPGEQPQEETGERWSTEDGRALITTAAQQLGLTERQPWEAKAGCAMAVFALVGLLIGGVVLLLLKLT